MRDRFVELLKMSRTLDTLYDTDWEDAADELLAAGVIVPPCKVGDMVYVLCEDFGSIFPCQIRTMNYVDGMWQGEMVNTWVHARGSIYNWTETEFGTGIFFTKEEAEKALAERREGDGT